MPSVVSSACRYQVRSSSPHSITPVSMPLLKHYSQSLVHSAVHDAMFTTACFHAQCTRFSADVIVPGVQGQTCSRRPVFISKLSSVQFRPLSADGSAVHYLSRVLPKNLIVLQSQANEAIAARVSAEKMQTRSSLAAADEYTGLCVGSKC